MNNSEILFTRQRHEAERAGLHYDYRIVIGDKAYSWATKKEMPEEGKSIIFHEQPVHTADYALSPRVEIPSGQYGAGVTTLDWVKKGRVEKGDGYYIVHTNDGGKFLLKHIPSYGEKQWLFKNLGMNKYLEKIAADLKMAEKSKQEEDKAIVDYGNRIQEAKDPGLKKALTHARNEEKDHSKSFGEVMKKLKRG